MDSLAGIEAKLDRAGELIGALHQEIAEYHESEPYTYRYERHEDPPRFVVLIDSVREPPLRFGVVLGEYVHNLRSALDHLVWQLALLRTENPSERLQFPIYTDPPKDWRSIAGDRLKDVPEDAIKLIESLQPYRSPNPTQQALAVVQLLSNEDKHRVILESVSVPVEADASNFDITGNDDVAEDVEVEFTWGGPLKPGERAMTLYYTPIGPNPGFRATATLPVEVAFGRFGFRAAVMPGLAGEIVRHVRGFRPFFGR